MYDLNDRVRVIKPGTCTIDPGNAASPLLIRLKQQMGIGGGSTVTLIRDGAERLLVDLGYEREAEFSPANDEDNRRALSVALSLAGVRPEEISGVLVTHGHRDHWGGIERFPRARWYCPRLVLPVLERLYAQRFIPLDEGDAISMHTTFLHTPGHTVGHGSLLWHTDAVRIAVAGDAIINLAWLQSGYTWRFNGDFWDADAARESAARLLHEADIVIPGHGEPFFTAGVR